MATLSRRNLLIAAGAGAAAAQFQNGGAALRRYQTTL